MLLFYVICVETEKGIVELGEELSFYDQVALVKSFFMGGGGGEAID